MKSLITFMLLCAIVLLSGPSFAEEAKKDEKKAAKPINKICPVEKGDVDPTITTEHKGKTIGFCCEGCIDEFKKDPPKYLAIIAKEKPAKDKDGKKDAKKAEGEEKEQKLNVKCPVTDDDADPTMTTEYKKQKIAFCCEGCIEDFEKEPKKYLAKLEKQKQAEKKKDKKKKDDKGEK